MDEFTQRVEQFHQAFKIHDQIAHTPVIPSPKVCLMRVQAMCEETAELAEALGNEDLVETLDALVDLQYFLSGTIVACGLQHVFQEAFAHVHETNMAKLGPDGQPILNKAGRVQKPEGWKPPELRPLLEDQPQTWLGWLSPTQQVAITNMMYNDPVKLDCRFCDMERGMHTDDCTGMEIRKRCLTFDTMLDELRLAGLDREEGR